MQLNSILLTQDQRYKRLHTRGKKGVCMIGMYKVRSGLIIQGFLLVHILTPL